MRYGPIKVNLKLIKLKSARRCSAKFYQTKVVHVSMYPENALFFDSFQMVSLKICDLSLIGRACEECEINYIIRNGLRIKICFTCRLKTLIDRCNESQIRVRANF